MEENFAPKWIIPRVLPILELDDEIWNFWADDGVRLLGMLRWGECILHMYIRWKAGWEYFLIILYILLSRALPKSRLREVIISKRIWIFWSPSRETVPNNTAVEITAYVLLEGQPHTWTKSPLFGCNGDLRVFVLSCFCFFCWLCLQWSFNKLSLQRPSVNLQEVLFPSVSKENSKAAENFEVRPLPPSLLGICHHLPGIGSWLHNACPALHPFASWSLQHPSAKGYGHLAWGMLRSLNSEDGACVPTILRTCTY